MLGFLIPFGFLVVAAKTNPRRLPGWEHWKKPLSVALLGVCVLAGATGMGQHKVWDVWMGWYDHSGNPLPRWDVISESDRALIDWLAVNTQPDEMLIASLTPRLYLQAKTGHPVLMEQETLWLMTYMPFIAPSAGMMARDLFDIDYSDPEQLAHLSDDGKLPPDLPVWDSAWKERSLGEWQVLGKKYGFRFVLSSSASPLDLPFVFQSSIWSVYRIP
jgi:hypothetical protein